MQQTGKIVPADTGSSLLQDPKMIQAYLGASGAELADELRRAITAPP